MPIFSGRFHAIFSAYVSIFAGLIETFFSILLGHAELSMSLYGIALMAIVDITGSVLVLLIWQKYDSDRNREKKILEARYSYIIGVLMMFLGLFLVADSVKTLIKGQHLEAVGGAGIALFGMLCSFVLAAYKYRIGEELESSVIVADAVSSVCSGLTSLVALVVAYNERFVWWLDGFAGLMVGFYTLYSGAATMTSSSHDLAEITRSEAKGIKMMDKNKYASYQESSPISKTPGDSGVKAGSGGLVDIMNTRPTPYNFDNENRNQLSVFRILYNQIHDNFTISAAGKSGTAFSYDRIPATDSEEEVTFSA